MNVLRRKIKRWLSFETREALARALFAWETYCLDFFISSQGRKLINTVFTGCSVTVIAWSVFWLIKPQAFAQDIAVRSVNPLALAFPWLMSGGVISILVGVIRVQYELCKRCFDCIVSAVCLIVLSPLFLIIAVLVKIDSDGPVFFRQERLGKDGLLFNILKFRTMRNNAELETGPVWAEDNDPRVTRLGQFLRKSHLDELPQLLNVVRGQMSLIGPRPERPEFSHEIKRHIPHFGKRLHVRPGITGLAQTCYPYGASIKDAARKLRYDVLYIKKMCWLLDFQIIFWTIGRVLTGEGAR